MPPSCRRASANFHVPVEQTPLLYKEGLEFLRQLWGQQPDVFPELFRLGPGAATQNLATGKCGVSS
jgi:hypothetical protein